MNFFKTGTTESITRLSFFSIVLCVLVWETYAVFTKTTVPHMAELLVFAGGILANKQYQERKGVTDVANPIVAK